LQLVLTNRDQTMRTVSQFPPLSCCCADHSALSSTVDGLHALLTLSFNNSMYFMFPKHVYSLLNINFNACFLLAEVILHFYYWHFLSSWNPPAMLHWIWIPVYVTVVWVPVNHVHWDTIVTCKETFHTRGVMWGFTFEKRQKNHVCWKHVRFCLKNYVTMSANIMFRITHISAVAVECIMRLFK
jgi:hypothetical protein